MAGMKAAPAPLCEKNLPQGAAFGLDLYEKPGNEDAAWQATMQTQSHSIVRAAALAVGSLAVGVFAAGALAVGAVAIGRLAIGRARIRRLEIDELVVRHLRVSEKLEVPPKSAGEA
jgi:hypothetical protein